ncbi:hypothetical protein D3C85_1687230 [compost metagenome]
MDRTRDLLSTFKHNITFLGESVYLPGNELDTLNDLLEDLLGFLNHLVLKTDNLFINRHMVNGLHNIHLNVPYELEYFFGGLRGFLS